MKRSNRLRRRIVRLLLLPLVLPFITAVPSPLYAQPISQQDPYYKLPPAAIGHDGSYLVVQDYKTLHRVDVAPGMPPTLGAEVPLPPEINGVWCLDAPDPASDPSHIVALAAHDEGGSDQYCLLRSVDFGESWEVVRSQALSDPLFDVTGDYWRASLRSMQWLPGGRTGWIWGSAGILRTIDGGNTWEIVYRSPVDNDNDPRNDERVNALGFRDADHGVAALGNYYEQKLYQTTDGGRTWNYAYLSLGQNKAIQISWAGNEWRVLSADPFKPLDQAPNTSIHFSSTAQQWSMRTPPIGTHQTEMSRIHWEGEKGGIMVLRSGEVWKTSDGGRSWEPIRSKDPDYPIEFGYFPGTKGFGSSTLFDVKGNDLSIFEASTVRPDGEIYRLKSWEVQSVASTPPVSSRLSTALKLKVFPNPAAVSAQAAFQLARPGRIRLSLIDARGDEVQQIDAGLMGSGEQRLMLDLNGLPAGPYRYILEVDTERAAGDLIVTR